MAPEEIEKMLQKQFAGAEVEVTDLTGGGDHFQIQVVAKEFEGKRSIDRHRMVYAALGNHVGAAIHAATLKTLTPVELKEKR